MAITTQDRFFGEGISNYGEPDPNLAFGLQRQFLRKKRLEDALGTSDRSFGAAEIATKFETIALAVGKADDQAFADNAEFCERYGIKR